MKKMKQILALLLCLTMTCSGPLNVLAEETDTTIEETVTEEEKSSVCEICQQESCICKAEEEPEIEENLLDTCEICQQEPCVCVAEEIEKSEEPAQVCENCQQEPCVCTSEETKESEELAQVCETCQQESCVCNQADAVSEKETTEPQIGDKIWIKHGSYVYKKQTEENGHKLLLNYEVQIVDIITDENGIANWYKFKFTSLGIAEFLLHDYKYVKVENTSIEEPDENEPVDENACNCGENAPENLADHADSCPRKQYIKSLFDGKNAGELYAQWETYDEATRNDILTMLEVYDEIKFEELKKLTCSTGPSDSTEDGLTITVSGDSLPDTVTLIIEEVNDSENEEILKQIGTVESISVANIEFTKTIDLKLYNEGKEWQPENGQFVNVEISGEDNIISKFMMINHILDTEDAIDRAIRNNTAIAYSEDGLSKAYPRETAAAKAVTGKPDTIYYTEISNESGDIRYTKDGGIEFTLDSFSKVKITGYTLDNQRDMPTFTADDGSGKIILDKYVEWIKDDEYKLTLEAYSTGQKETKATDVVFIIDQSCSMYSPVDPKAAKGGATTTSSRMSVETLKKLDMTKPENQKAALEGYYVAVFYDSDNLWYTIPVRYSDGKWQRTKGNGSRSVGMWVSETITEVWNDEWIDLTEKYTDGKEFTIYKSVYGAAYDAMEAFIDTMEGENGEGTPNCRASIVGFSCPYDGYGNGPMNTGIYVNGNQKFGLEFREEEYQSSFNDMSTDEGIAAFRRSINAVRTSGQTTTTDAGFKLARDVLTNASNNDTEKVVILFTDGKPENQISPRESYDNYTAAIATANTVKQLANTSVYTYGIELGSVTTDFLKALSSSYPKATSASQLGEYVSPKCWGMAADSADIQNAFKNIAQQIVSSSVAWDGTTKLKDIITDEFKLPDGATTDDIIVKTADWNGNQFAEPVVASGYTVNISGDNTIDVSGFDYSEKYVTSGVSGGQKLVVEVPIVVDRLVCQGGNDLDTNTENSALWSGSTKIAAFPVPEVDVMTSISVHKTVMGKSYVDSFDFGCNYKKFERYNPNKGVDLNAETTDVTISERIGNDDSFVVSGIKIGTKLTLEEKNADKYEMTVVVKDKSGNIVSEGITKNGHTITIESVSPGMRIEVRNTALFADLTIIKDGIEPIDHHDATSTSNKERQSTVYTITDGDAFTMDVAISGNDAVTIRDLPIGSYMVTENTDWSWRYDVKSINAEKYTDAVVDKANGSICFDLTYDGETVSFDNTRTDIYWLSGDSYCENWWGGVGGTKVVKRNEKNEVLND